MKTNFLAFLALVVLTTSSCTRIIFDSGPLVVEDRFINDNWERISVNGSMDVVLVQDADFDIRVEAGGRKMEYIETRVVDNQLVISELRNNILNDKQTKVWVSKSWITSIQINGSGDMRGGGLVSNYLTVDINGSGNLDMEVDIADYINLDIAGSGDVRLEGNSHVLTLYVNGSGDTDARYLPVNTCTVVVNGSGNSRVQVSGDLQVDINGSGDVYYWGQPNTVYVNNNGSGDVYSMN